MKYSLPIINHFSFIKLVLLLIFSIGFFIRIYSLDSVPPGFFADEASIGYNAYTILTKGVDENGNRFPVLFQNFGNLYRPGIPVYISSLFVQLLGLNEFSLRLASVLLGSLTIIIIFYITKILFFSDRVGLFSAIFLAISPWHIHFSRINQEFIYLVFFLSLSVLLFLFATKNNRPIYFIFSLFSFGLSLYTYVPAYFIVPLFIVLILLIYRDIVVNNIPTVIIGLSIFLALSSPLLLGLKDGKTLSRFIQVSRANQQKTTTEMAEGIVKTYIAHFSPEFLFQKGDIGYPTHFITRFSVRGMGQLYWVQLPLIVFGLIYSLQKKYKKGLLVLLGWLLIYPLGSTMAPFADGGGPFAMRSIIGVIPFQILSALGIVCIINLSKRRIIQGILITLLFIPVFLSFKNYANRYFTQYPLYAADFWGWQYGAKYIVRYFSDHQYQYDQMYMQPEFNAPDIFFKFYAPESCNKCLVGTPYNNYNPSFKQLFAITPLFLQQHPTILLNTREIIYYPNGTEAFRIGEINHI